MEQAILDNQALYPEVGYRRLSYMMIDTDVAAVSPSSVFRVLKQAGPLSRSPSGSSTRGKGFQQPQKAHAHSPRVISDNGPQFIAKDFKEFIRISGMSQVRTSPYHPESNGKLERWNGSIKSECIRPQVPLSLEEARRLIAQYVQVYNEQRLHSSLQSVTPKDWLAGRQADVLAARQRKLSEPSLRRRQALRTTVTVPFQETAVQLIILLPGETEAGSAGTQPCRGIAWRDSSRR